VLLSLRIEFLCETNSFDVQTLAELRTANEAFLRECLVDGNFVQWLVLDGEEIAATGGASFYRLPPNGGCKTGLCAYISNMYTRSAYCRQGIAMRILSLLVAEAERRGCGKILLHATEVGRPVYEKFGFKDMEGDMVCKLPR